MKAKKLFSRNVTLQAGSITIVMKFGKNLK